MDYKEQLEENRLKRIRSFIFKGRIRNQFGSLCLPCTICLPNSIASSLGQPSGPLFRRHLALSPVTSQATKSEIIPIWIRYRRVNLINTYIIQPMPHLIIRVSAIKAIASIGFIYSLCQFFYRWPIKNFYQSLLSCFEFSSLASHHIASFCKCSILCFLFIISSITTKGASLMIKYVRVRTEFLLSCYTKIPSFIRIATKRIATSNNVSFFTSWICSFHYYNYTPSVKFVQSGVLVQ